MKVIWTAEEDEKLRDMYAGVELMADDMARILGKTKSAVYRRAHSLGLYRPREIRVVSGSMSIGNPNITAHQFKKGNVPVIKGKHHSEAAMEKLRKSGTWFEKGNLPHNTRETGAERIDEDGYTVVKVGNRNWQFKHRMLWEAANGPIPDGYSLWFKDGNRQNITLDNLELIPFSERVLRNTIHRYPEDVALAMRRIGRLKALIKRTENGK